MDKLSGFGTFEKTVMAIINGVREAVREKKWPMLVGYFFSVLLILTVGFFGSVGAVVGGLSALNIVKENIYAPKRELTYERKSETINQDGSYTTVFILKFLTPSGQGGTLIYKKPKNAECSDDLMWITGGIEFKGGIPYKAEEYEVACTSKEPITDNYRLFSIDE